MINKDFSRLSPINSTIVEKREIQLKIVIENKGHMLITHSSGRIKQSADEDYGLFEQKNSKPVTTCDFSFDKFVKLSMKRKTPVQTPIKIIGVELSQLKR